MTGTVTLSVEIELAWGVAHVDEMAPLERHSPNRREETARLDALLAVCDELDLPISFDAVGHLLLESCSGAHAGPHPAGWFESDPGTSHRDDPLYYAPDLIDAVTGAPTEHELCTHTFSHARCDQTDPAVLDWELRRVAEVHNDRDAGPVTSFVPPVHAPPPRDVLREHDIRTVRRPVEYRPPVADPDPPSGPFGQLIWRLRRLDPVEMLFRTPTIRDPKRRNGLTETYVSWHTSLSAPYLRNGRVRPHPVYRAVPRSIRQHHHLRHLLAGLREAARTDTSIHYWTHLFNLAPAEQWAPVRNFLRALARYRDQGAVQVSTMNELASGDAPTNPTEGGANRASRDNGRSEDAE